ncbi:MAG: hypothetical protein R2712_06765 [Vicinamibacterales bacterium]
MTTIEAPRPAAPRSATTVGASRSSEFDDVIALHATAQGVSPDLVRAVIRWSRPSTPGRCRRRAPWA